MRGEDAGRLVAVAGVVLGQQALPEQGALVGAITELDRTFEAFGIRASLATNQIQEVEQRITQLISFIRPLTMENMNVSFLPIRCCQ